MGYEVELAPPSWPHALAGQQELALPFAAGDWRLAWRPLPSPPILRPPTPAPPWRATAVHPEQKLCHPPIGPDGQPGNSSP